MLSFSTIPLKQFEQTLTFPPHSTQRNANELRLSLNIALKRTVAVIITDIFFFMKTICVDGGHLCYWGGLTVEMEIRGCRFLGSKSVPSWNVTASRMFVLRHFKTFCVILNRYVIVSIMPTAFSRFVFRHFKTSLKRRDMICDCH